MIKTFKDKETEKLFNRERSRCCPEDIQKTAQRKLEHLESAESLGDLAFLPGNLLEALKHDRKGQHSIRINDQWRVCFVWKDGDAYNVEICDYH